MDVSVRKSYLIYVLFFFMFILFFKHFNYFMEDKMEENMSISQNFTC